jgi:hypothetical protein
MRLCSPIRQPHVTYLTRQPSPLLFFLPGTFLLIPLSSVARPENAMVSALATF